MRSRHFAVAVLMLGLAGCSGDNDEPAAASTPSVSVSTTTPEATSQAPEPTSSIKVEVADPKALSEVEESMQALNAERESLDTNEYLNRANELTARAAAAYGPEGLGAFSCQMAVGIVSGAQGAEPAAVRVGLGNTLKVIVRNATGELNQTLAGADVDGLMLKTCPDVRTAALQATGLKTLNAL
ncbi:hypothetical protein LWF15_12650 [Kineosporia rhizophila]|uniref:hypothetical protein n=1 Tax=Kineosporia TaxID=49184 RepID=UPI001E33CD7C|nr:MULTISPECIES: hypothetical protein [Kineosporia]MCE0536360.1 hypothetical protein [Kineosporia rhizophila]GLY19835.1 hypothetical protein Kisp01_68490 [Kineosporia sp. NBRC 101677]